MGAYYNELDPFAAAWLRELIADGLIAPGYVDERSIVDVRPADLAGYRQCHFFAGIGVWSLALRNAGWADDRPIWTASCPCQPFSAAGKGGGFADERHLWPYLYWLVAQRRPAIIVGEQVGSDDGLAWLDVVQADLDQADYTSGALDTCAAGFGAPHIRQRLYWLAHADDEGLEGWGRVRERADELVARARGVDGRMAYATICGHGEHERDTGTVAGAGGRCEGQQSESWRTSQAVRDRGKANRPGPSNGLWRNADWLGCRDGKWRPVSPGTFPLVATGSVRNRVGTLRGAGNALNVAQAQAFIECLAAPSPMPGAR